MRNGTLGTYTPEGYAATLAKLQFLRGRSAPVGSPDESLDYYAKANDALAALIALPAPAASDFAAYQAVVGDVAVVAGSAARRELGARRSLPRPVLRGTTSPASAVTVHRRGLGGSGQISSAPRRRSTLRNTA